MSKNIYFFIISPILTLQFAFAQIERNQTYYKFDNTLKSLSTEIIEEVSFKKAVWLSENGNSFNETSYETFCDKGGCLKRAAFFYLCI